MCSGGRWTDDEHERFLRGLELYGRKWSKIANFVQSRSSVQVRTHAQGYLLGYPKPRKEGSSMAAALGLTRLRDSSTPITVEHRGIYKADINATAPVATQWRGKNMANMLAGKQRALASKKRALQERDEALKQATKRVARVEKERDDHESRGELLDSMVSPLESQRRELQEIVGAAAKALINRGVPTRVLPDADTPFYYARNSWDTEQRVPWNAEAGRPMSLAEGIAWLHDHGS